MAVKRSGADPKKDIESIVKIVKDNANGIRTSVMNTTKGQVARRVFNKGTATDGSVIGQYSTGKDGGYKKLRNTIGRRIDKVDLELTSTLRQSLVVH